MRIAFLTNTLDNPEHVNIGDVFIGQGLKYLFDRAFKNIEWVDISRFSPFDQEDYDKMNSCDFVIYAGMPQYNNLDDWSFYYDEQIWHDLKDKVKLPVLRLAGGGGYPSETMKPKAFSEHLSKSQKTIDVLKFTERICKLYTTRDSMAQQFLIDNGIKSTLLPCSGTFACHYWDIHQTTKEFSAICITSPYIKDREDEEKIMHEWIEVKNYLEKFYNKPCKVICQEKKTDYDYLLKWFKEDKIFMEKSSKEITEFYGKIDVVVTTRIHCALPIFGIGGRPIIIRVDTRGSVGEIVDIPIVKLDGFDCKMIRDINETKLFSKFDPIELMKSSINFYSQNVPIALKDIWKWD